MKLTKKALFTLSLIHIFSIHGTLSLPHFLKGSINSEIVTQAASLMGISILCAWSFGLIFESFTVATIPEFLAHVHNDLRIYKYKLCADQDSYDEALKRVKERPFFTILHNVLKNYSHAGLISGVSLFIASHAKYTCSAPLPILCSAQASTLGLLTIIAGTAAFYGYHSRKIVINDYERYNPEKHYSDVSVDKKLLVDLMEKTRRFSLLLTIATNVGLTSYSIAKQLKNE